MAQKTYNVSNDFDGKKENAIHFKCFHEKYQNKIFLKGNIEHCVVFDRYEMKYIYVDKNNRYLISLDGILFNKDLTNLIKYPSKKKEEIYKIPETVKTINEGAFRYAEIK